MKIKKLVLTCMLSVALCCIGATGLMLGGCGGEHEWVDATCTAPRTCLTCGETKGEPLGHSWDQEVCGTAKNCTVCGEVEAFDHVVVVDAKVDATCEEDGLTEGSHCSICNTVIVAQEVIPALGHNFVYTSNEDGTHVVTCLNDEAHNCVANCSKEGATCTEDAACDYCNYIFRLQTEHQWGEGVITTHATCTESGELTYTCEECGHTKTEAVSNLGHNYKDTVVAPTCVEKGYTLHECLNGCGDSYKDSETDTVDHSWSGVATCEEGVSCSVCGATAPALGHSYEFVGFDEATCLLPEIHYYECSTCFDRYSEEIGAAKGHDIVGVTALERETGIKCQYELVYGCKDCGAEVVGDNVYHHSYVASLVSEANCISGGEKLLTCSDCGDSYSEATEAEPNGHVWLEGSVDSNKRTDECKYCHETKSVTVFTGTETGAVKADDLKDTEIALNNANMSLDQGVLDAIKEQTEGKDISISAGTVDKDQLNISDTQLAQIGNSQVYNFTITDSENKAVAEFGEENFVTITLPYVLEEGEDVDSIAVWYIGLNGELKSIQASYSNGFVTFKTNHFSYYTVTKLTPKERCALYGHIYSEKKVEGDCLNDGYILKLCIRCHDTIKEITHTASGHDYEESVTNATCTEAGSIVYTCKNENCNHSYTTRINALGHEWILIDSAEASCTAAGYEKFGCAHENCEEGYEVTYAQLKHTLQSTEVLATCESAGYVVYSCENCDYSYTADYTSAIGHDYDFAWDWNEDALTGASLRLTCKHDEAHQLGFGATLNVKLVPGACPAGDRTEVRARVVYNGNVYEDLYIIEADSSKHAYDQIKYNEKEHWFECVCGLKQEATAHTYAQSIVKEATCGEDGEKLFACECGYSYTEAIPATGKHEYVQSIVKEATCGEDGEKLFTCECGDTYTEVIPATGKHEYVQSIVKEATCGEDGEKLFTCECGDSYTEVIPATGEHEYENDVCVGCGKQYGECEHIELNEVLLDLEALGACKGAWIKYYTCECGEVVVLQNVDLDSNILHGEAMNISCTNVEEFDDDYWEEDGVEYMKSSLKCLDCGLILKAEASCRSEGCLETYDYAISIIFNEETLVNKATFTVEEEWHSNTKEEKLDLTEFGACGGYLEVERCSDCGKIDEVLDVMPKCANLSQDMQEGETEEGYPYMYQKMECADCGFTVFMEMWAVVDGCITEITQHGIISVGETVIYEIYDTRTNSQHVWEYEYELFGASCEDGYRVTQICTVCGERDSWTSEGHRSEWKEIYMGEHGACDACLRVEVCEICEEIVYLDGNIGCPLDITVKENIVDENGVAHNIMKGECPKCGLLYDYDEWEESNTCETTVNRKVVMTINGEVIFDYTQRNVSTSHEFEYEYEFEGESCEDGYKQIGTCVKCGKVEEFWNKGHNSIKSEIVLTEFGACGGVLEVEKCAACGLVLNMMGGQPECALDYDNPEMSEFTDENGFVHQEMRVTCLDCGAVVSSEQWVENISVCITVEHMYGCMYIGDTVIFEYSDSYRRDNHQFVTEIEFEGESCEDGYYVREYCTVCGEGKEYYENGHRFDDKGHIEFAKYGACGGWADALYCSICEKIVEVHGLEIYCEFSEPVTEEQVDEKGIAHEITTLACPKCGLIYVQDAWTIAEGCTTYEYARLNISINGEVVLDFVRSERRENHEYKFEYDMDGESCNDGVTVRAICEKCGYEQYYGHFLSHATFTKETYDLTEYGACYGEIRYDECPCGEISRIYNDSCAHYANSNTYEDEQGILHDVYVNYCPDCGLRIQTDSYSVKEEGTCQKVTYSYTMVTVGASLVCESEYVQRQEDHNYQVEAQLMRPGTSCEQGVLVTETCVDCGYSNEREYYHHEMVVSEEINLQELGATCYAIARFESCVCGRETKMNMNDVLCHFEGESHPVWVEGFIEGHVDGMDQWYEYNAELFTCSVTDPDRCAFKYRYAYYYLLEESECRAYLHYTWQFGYNEEDDTFLYEKTVRTSQWLDCHHYLPEDISSTEENVDHRGTLYTCTICSSTYKRVDSYERVTRVDQDGNEMMDEEGNVLYEERHIRSEREWIDTRFFAEISYKKEINCYTYVEYEINGNINSTNYSNYHYYTYISNDGHEYWSETHTEMDYTYQGPFGDHGYSSREEFESSYGEHWIRIDEVVWFYGDIYTILYYYENVRDGYWERNEYTYSFEGPCMCNRIHTDSHGYSYEENYECCRMTHGTIISATCTQYGLEGSHCYVCGFVGDNYQTNPHGHSWDYVNEEIGYVCLNCGLQNANGASGDVVMEDLTAKYGAGENYVAGYWDRSMAEFTSYVSLILHKAMEDGSDEIVLFEAEIFSIEGINALACSKAQVEELALNLYGLTPDMYDVRISFVPMGADGSWDYAITFNDDVFDAVVSTNSNLPIYVDRGEYYEITIVPEESGIWEMYSYVDGDTYGYLYDVNGTELMRDDDSLGFHNNFRIECHLEAGQTYVLKVRWYNSEMQGNINVAIRFKG
ncbi:MAG: hypothetical protein E7339_04050 [Clostridiales bacterium]|nr:hypothetical protein [Clostridiales bacterium]